MSATWDADAHIDVMSLLMGVAVSDGERPEVRRFLEIAHDMADLVAEADLAGDDGLELAPTSVPVGPAGGR